MLGQRAGFYGDELEIVILVALLTAAALTSIHWSTSALERAELRRTADRQREEERLRLLLEAVPDGVVVVNRRGAITFTNNQAEKLFGYPHEELLGQQVEILIPWRFRGEHTRHFEHYFDSPRVHPPEAERELYGLRKDGSEFPVEIALAPVQTAKELLVSANLCDVTERKRAEDALSGAEAQSRRSLEMLDATHDGIFMFGPETLRFSYVNKGAAQQTGYRREELLAMTPLDIQPLFDEAGFRQILAPMLAGQTPEVMFETVHRRKDGRDLPVEIILQAIPSKRDGRVFVALVRDITKRKRTEETLRQSESTLRSLVDNAPYAIYRTSLKTGKFTSVNPALIRMLGYSTAEEVLALDLARDVYRDARDRATMLAEILRLGSFKNLELRWKRKDGEELVVRASGRVLRAEDGQQYVESVNEDITEQRLVEQQFRQAQKMEAIGQLAGGVAHDFNNLLMVISSFTEMMGSVGPTNEKQQQYLQQVMKATRRAAGLTQQLLAFSRKQVLAPTVLDLNAVVGDLAKMLPRLIGEHIEMRLLPRAQHGSIEADRGQLEQVIMNLAINARDAMPKGGTLVIEVQDVTFDQPHLGPNYSIPPGDYVLLAVSDNGTGMDAETQAHIFEPFFTTKEQGKGTGLGLATVYGIVKQSGGYIFVYSEKGVGTTFKMYFPRAEKGISADRAQAPAQASAGGAETILLVEDENAVRIAVREFLQSKGYTVLDAADPAEALRKLAQQAAPVHLLITDVVMPGTSGPELVERLRLHDPRLKVLYVSGYTDGAIASVASLGKEAAFLQKPFALDFLAHKVRAILDAPAAATAPESPGGASSQAEEYERQD